MGGFRVAQSDGVQFNNIQRQTLKNIYLLSLPACLAIICHSSAPSAHFHSTGPSISWYRPSNPTSNSSSSSFSPIFCCPGNIPLRRDRNMASNLPPSSVVSHEDIKVEAQGQSYDLSQAEQDNLARQLSLPPVKASYLMLYRYATRMDLLIILVSSFCAIAAGAIFPIMTVNTPLNRTLEDKLNPARSYLATLLQVSSHFSAVIQTQPPFDMISVTWHYSLFTWA
jgi:hypothetical protein